MSPDPFLSPPPPFLHVTITKGLELRLVCMYVQAVHKYGSCLRAHARVCTCIMYAMFDQNWSIVQIKRALLLISMEDTMLIALTLTRAGVGVHLTTHQDQELSKR